MASLRPRLTRLPLRPGWWLVRLLPFVALLVLRGLNSPVLASGLTFGANVGYLARAYDVSSDCGPSELSKRD